MGACKFGLFLQKKKKKLQIISYAKIMIDTGRWMYAAYVYSSRMKFPSYSTYAYVTITEESMKLRVTLKKLSDYTQVNV